MFREVWERCGAVVHRYAAVADAACRAVPAAFLRVPSGAAATVTDPQGDVLGGLFGRKSECQCGMDGGSTGEGRAVYGDADVPLCRCQRTNCNCACALEEDVGKKLRSVVAWMHSAHETGASGVIPRSGTRHWSRFIAPRGFRRTFRDVRHSEASSTLGFPHGYVIDYVGLFSVTSWFEGKVTVDAMRQFVPVGGCVMDCFGGVGAATVALGDEWRVIFCEIDPLRVCTGVGGWRGGRQGWHWWTV